MNTHLTRRQFLQTTAALGAGAALAPVLRAEPPAQRPPLIPRADSMILIWMPGGVAQTDTWDPKKHTPFRKGMKGSELLGTCPSIPTSADGISLGAGLENIASVMNHGAILRTFTNESDRLALHMKFQHYMMTGYTPPVGVKVPSIGAVIARTLGRRDPHVPPYIYIGRDIDTSDEEKRLISEFLGPGFYGINYAPFMIPDPARGLATLNAAAGMKIDRLNQRQELLRTVAGLGPVELHQASKVSEYLKTMEDARAMMDSPVKQAFDYAAEETPGTLAAYQPDIAQTAVLDPSYYHGTRFGHSLLLARRLVEHGARFVQVEYQYGPFKGFDMHENGRRRIEEMKKQIDRPIAQLIRDLHARGLLERTLVVLMTEFGRMLETGAKADGSDDQATGEKLVIEDEKLYGFHGHFKSASCMTFFGGGFRKGYVHGKTADRHPMVPIENPVSLEDVHATLYHAMGIPPNTAYLTEDRPFYVTKDGRGQPIEALLA